jgi:hypothetical protein
MTEHKDQAERNDQERLLRAALGAIRELMRTFQAERYVYLGLCVLSFALLFYALALVMTGATYSETFLISMFGSSGLVAAASFRVTMFLNKSFSLIEKVIGRML